MTESAHCLVCSKEVTRKQHALQCDQCNNWQHRLCGTGITQSDYRMMVRGVIEVEWSCSICKSPVVDNSQEEEDHLQIPAMLHDITSAESDLMEVEQRVTTDELEDRPLNIPDRDVQRPARILDVSVREPHG
ncbi:uncharacterized protein LOC132715984 [Ruditapes philippinarum]|uniref:uncharacterized protein LOC132715984 n=1 Tax=Ruditapes philippinarum TaxID=129788 RepID=UPI00295AD029|nr:uncharacterized protein LOC132715984 [Ruditapes philippinarum]